MMYKRYYREGILEMQNRVDIFKLVLVDNNMFKLCLLQVIIVGKTYSQLCLICFKVILFDTNIKGKHCLTLITFYMTFNVKSQGDHPDLILHHVIFICTTKTQHLQKMPMNV